MPWSRWRDATSRCPDVDQAAGRLNLPAVFLYGGGILPGRGPHGEALDIVSVFEAVGASAWPPDRRGAEFDRKERLPDGWQLAGMFTANTMASVSEALGMALPGSASPAAVDSRRDELAVQSGRAVGTAAGAGNSAPTDHDEGCVRERHRRHHGPRRLDQCGAAPAGHRQRGSGRTVPRRFRSDWLAASAHRGYQAPRPLAWSMSMGWVGCRW